MIAATPLTRQPRRWQPERIDAGFLAWIASIRQRVALVIHANHANELDGLPYYRTCSIVRPARPTSKSMQRGRRN